MNRTPNISDVGRTSGCDKSDGDRQETNESTNYYAEETSQLLLEEKQVIVRREEDLKSEIERDVIALNPFVPINRLSDDVLCHIFELHCKDSPPATLPRSRNRRRPAPPQITLSHVCSTWREIMIDVPTFWRSIRIVPRILNTPWIIDRTVGVANTWLSRAKGLPCSIDIDIPNDNKICNYRRLPWGKHWHENIIKDLISRHRFQKLGVTFEYHQLRDLLQLSEDKLSCVEDLCLRYTSLVEDDTVSPLDLHKLSNLTTFSLLPDPSDLYALSDPLGGYSGLTNIPWHNLRHIQFRATMPASFCLDALEQCSAILETCSLAITDDDVFNSSPRVPVHLIQLRELDVVLYSWSSTEEEILESFLLSLRFPNLKSLTLGSCEYPVNLEIILRVQNASQMQLEELIIPESTPDVDLDVRTLLMGFPSLKRLELPNEVTFTDEAVNEVGAGSIGVFLEHLTINDSGFDLETLLQMVKARSRAGDKDGKRWNEATEFKFVTLHCDEADDKMEDEVLYLIEEIKRSGVDLNVVFANDSDKEQEPFGFYDDHSESSYDSDDEAIYGDDY